MKINDILPHFLENTDVVFFENLATIISEGNCSAFVGAGLSRNYGYPSTSDLIAHLRSNSDVSAEELEGCTSFMEQASLLHARMGSRFFENLFIRFDPDHFGVENYGPIFEYIINLPFKAYVTTNYDDCIRNAARMQDVEFEDYQVYPAMRVGTLDKLGLYHIHGRIDFEYPDSSGQGIVLTLETYQSAYSSESRLPLFLNSIFDSHDFVFLGFGLEEPTLEEVLARCKQRDEAAAYWDNRPDRERRRYALLPVPESYRIVTEMAPEQKSKTLAQIANIRRQDEVLNRQYGILVIRYFANEHHSQLRRIIEFLYQRFGKRSKVTKDLSGREIIIS